MQMSSFVSQNEYGCSSHELKLSVDQQEGAISIQQNCGSRNVASVTVLPVAKVQARRFPDNVLSWNFVRNRLKHVRTIYFKPKFSGKCDKMESTQPSVRIVKGLCFGKIVVAIGGKCTNVR